MLRSIVLFLIVVAAFLFLRYGLRRRPATAATNVPARRLPWLLLAVGLGLVFAFGFALRDFALRD